MNNVIGSNCNVCDLSSIFITKIRLESYIERMWFYMGFIGPLTLTTIPGFHGM